MVEGNLATYVEGMKVYKPNVSEQFPQSQNEGEVQGGALKFIVSIKTSVATMGLVVEGTTSHKKPMRNCKKDL